MVKVVRSLRFSKHAWRVVYRASDGMSTRVQPLLRHSAGNYRCTKKRWLGKDFGGSPGASRDGISIAPSPFSPRRTGVTSGPARCWSGAFDRPHGTPLQNALLSCGSPGVPEHERLPAGTSREENLWRKGITPLDNGIEGV
jgi:hypothetical protein